MVCFHLLIPVVVCVFCQKLPIPDFTSCFVQIGLLWFLFKPQQYWEQWHLREIMLCVGSWWDLWRCGKDLAGHKTKLMVGRRPYLWHIRRSLVWLIQAFRCTHTHFRNYFLGGNALTDALTVSSKICKQVETSKDGGPMDHWTRDKRGWSSMKGRVFPCILGTQTPCISEHRLLILKQGPGVYPVYT